MKRIIVAGVAALVLIVATANVKPTFVWVEYRVDGFAPAARLTFTVANGDVARQDESALPWVYRFPADIGASLSIAAQGDGALTCHLFADGVEQQQVTADGASATVTCSGHAVH